MRFALLAIPATLCLAVIPVYGQGSRSSTPPAPRKEELRGTADQLKQAREKMDPSQAAKAAEGVAEKLPGNLSKAAKSAMESPEAKQQAIDAIKSAAGNLLPEAQKLMKRGDAAAATDPSGAPAAANAPPAGDTGPKPMPLQPLIEPAAAIRSTATVTIDSDDAVFDLKAGIFIYRGHVRARHPQFYIECEELEVHMVVEDPDAPPATAEKNNANPKAKPNGAPKTDPILAKSAEKPKENAIKMAIARGPMVTIEKVSEQGEVQQAKCRRALYEASTGEITMTDYPQVLRGNVLQAATSPSTTMVFSQKGKLTTNGPSKTDILSRSETEGELPGELTPKPRGQ